MNHRRYLAIPCLAAVLGLGVAGCLESAPKPAPAPAPATDVGRVAAWRDAERIAAADSGRFTVIGNGESMRPVYGESTVLVISKVAYEDLKPGMQVAYANRAGRRVVHVLISPDARGWRVQGLNNVVEDYERVTRHNLLGVVYASFTTDAELD